MQTGAQKCGVTVFNGDLDQLRQTKWKLKGCEVPVVESYTYLGMELHYDLDLNKTAKAVTSKARKAMMVLKPSLVNRSIPVAIKVLMVKTLVYPIAAMGGELLGMNQGYAKDGQKLINQALIWIMSGDRAGRGVLTLPTLEVELGVVPLHVETAARRTRALAKYKTLNTWIATLVSNPMKARKKTWVTGTTLWLSR